MGAWGPNRAVGTRCRMAVVIGAAALTALSACSGGAGSDAGRVPGTASATTRPTSTSTSTTAVTTTTTPSTTTTAAPTTTLPPGPARFTMSFSGDLLTHLPLNAQAAAYGRPSGARYDFGPMLAPVAPVISAADIAICHLEVPLAADQSRISGYPSFGAPEELVPALAATGFDGCSTASNHSLDQGRSGITATLDRLDAAGLHHVGTARSAEEDARPATYDVGGATVAHLSYAYGFNGYRIPSDAPWSVDQIDVDAIHADATAARQAGADVVVVSLHWGTEYRADPDAYQRDVAARLLPWPDIDLVVGHHAHVVQPIERVEGTFVVWGLGNQLANQAQVPRSDGLTAIATFERGLDGRYRAVGIEAVPTYVEAGGSFRVWPVVRTLADPVTPLGLRRALEASYDRTAAVLARTPTEGVSLATRP